MGKKPIRIILLFSLSAIAAIAAPAQEKSLEKTAGKVVHLRLISYANDGVDKYIFKYPTEISPLEDGCFLLIDNTQVLKFAANGKFLKLFVQKGVGPGEALYLNQLYLNDNRLIVNTGIMAKLMTFDLDGNLKSEYKRQNSPAISRNTLGIGESSLEIIGSTKDRDFIAVNPGSLANKFDIKAGVSWKPVFLISETNELKKLLFEIPLKADFIDTPMGKKAISSLTLKSAHDKDNIYYCNTERYEIKVYDITANTVASTWKRPYTPIPIPKNDKNKYRFGQQIMIDKGGKSATFASPSPGNFPDIQKLCAVENQLWVITSTVDTEKGVLIDVFDKAGNYVNHFYLYLRGKLDLHQIEVISIRGKTVYVRELDEEENFMIVKYEMIDQS